CRISPSLVHSVNFTWPTSLGVSQVVAFSSFTFWLKGFLVGAQGLHFSIKRFQRRLIEAGADMPGVDPAFLQSVAYRKHQRAEVLAVPVRLCVTDYHPLLVMYRLELEPLARSLARVVETRRALGNHALLMRALCLREFPLAELGNMLAVPQQRVARQESFQD